MSKWLTTPLGGLTINLDGKRRPVKEVDREPGPYPYYGASGIVDYVSDYLIDGDYLLIAEDGENLRTRQTPIAFMARGKSWVNNHAHIVTGNERADTRFLMYAIQAQDVSPYLTGAVMPKLTQGNLNKIPITHPEEVDDQRAIAHILGTLDDKIELNRRTNETLEAMARAIFKSWFIDFDPVRAKASGEPPESICRRLGLTPELLALFPDDFQESELGTIPSGWTVSTIGALAEIVGGGTPSTKEPAYWDGGEHCWVTPKDLSRLATPVLLASERRITDAGLAQIGSGLLPKGTVLLSSRAPIGYRAIAEVPVAVNQGFIAMQAKADVSSYFLLYWAESAHQEIVGRANGSTFLEISKSSFRPIPLVAPPKAVFDAFHRLLEPIYQRMVANERETAALTEQRDTLLPRLLSGEMDIAGMEMRDE